MRFADEIIVLSENVKNYFLKEYNRKTVLIPNGITKPEKIDADEITKMSHLEKLNSNVVYENILEDVNLEYIVVSNTIKENIILSLHILHRNKYHHC